MEMLLDGLAEALHLIASGDFGIWHAVWVSLGCSLSKRNIYIIITSITLII